MASAQQEGGSPWHGLGQAHQPALFLHPQVAKGVEAAQPVLSLRACRAQLGSLESSPWAASKSLSC